MTYVTCLRLGMSNWPLNRETTQELKYILIDCSSYSSLSLYIVLGYTDDMLDELHATKSTEKTPLI